MATFSNRVARRVARNTVFADIQKVVASTTTFNQGDLLVMDTTNHIVALASNETDGANFLGIAPISVSNGKPLSAYSTDVDGAVGSPAMAGPEFGDEVYVTLKGGQTIQPGGSVYLDPADGAQFVQNSGTKIVGTYVGGAAYTAPSGGGDIIVKLGSRYPDDTLKF